MSSDLLHGHIELTEKNAAILRIRRSEYFSGFAKSAEKPVNVSVFYYRLPTDSLPDEKTDIRLLIIHPEKRRSSNQFSSKMTSPGTNYAS
jgi:hypothetical protein